MTPRDLIQQWREKGASCDTFHATMGVGWKTCADELEACLSAPAEAEYPRLRDELLAIAAWIRTPGNINPDDAIDECARVLENRVVSLLLPASPAGGPPPRQERKAETT